MPQILTTARRALTLLFCASAVGVLSGAARAADPTPIVLVPRPASLTANGGAPFELRSGVQIVASPEHNAKDAAGFLADWLLRDTGIRIPVVVAAPNSQAAMAKGAIVVTETGADGKLGDEGYALTVTTRNISVRAPHGAGLFYGGETIRQLLRKPETTPVRWTIPAVTIRDQPRYPERSLMIDSARHYQSVAFLKRTLDLLAYHKMNTLHWHISDDQGWRLEIKRYPKLTEVGAYRKFGSTTYGAFYSQDQVRDLVAYAAARHITIVPELDMPAHCLSLLAAYPENACFPRAFQVPTQGITGDTPWSPDVLCAGREETYTFMENILTEVMALFPSKAVHIGGDECPTVRWKTCPVCQAKIKALNLKDERALQNYFTNRIAAFLTAHGRRLQGWNEIMEGGSLPKDVIVQPWNRPETAAAAARAGNDVVVSSTRYGYFDYGYNSISLQRVYEWNPTPTGLNADDAKRIQGLEACLWTEGKKDDADADYYIWPRTLAIAEDGWSPMSLRDWPDFKNRLESVHYARLAAMGLGNPVITDPGTIEAALVARSGFNPGVKLGEWLPAQMSEKLISLDWPLDAFLNGPGKYSVRFDYTDGACGIDIASVDLVRNGTEILSTDTHDAFSGGNSHDQTYTVSLPTVDPASKYTLRVRLRSDGGTDSKGSLFLTTPSHKTAPKPAPQPVPSAAEADTFELKDGKFVLNGKPFVIISGEMHYERIPREYWRHRLKMAKAMGLNTIATYVFWNMQEPEKGKFDFRGNADLAAFIRIAREEGLYILLRTGPYACAEWEYGGYPYWLLNEKTDGKPLVVRSTDPNFLRYSARFIEQVGKQCVPLQAGRTGGNILMVQVENEYGSFGKDKVYMAAVRDMIRNAGFTVPLYTADGPSQMPSGDIDGALPCLDGASASGLAATIDKAHPGGPYFASETYPGWLDHWGEKFNRNNPEREAKALTSFVEKGYSVNLYMFHGGTNFGFMNGANTGGTFEPSITSYDYGAPLDEAGRPTKMYDLMRAALEPLVPTGSIPAVPANNPIVAVPRFSLATTGSLFGTLPKPITSDGLKTMEDLGQAYGFVLYRTHVNASATAGPAPLTIKGLRDYAVVMVDGKTVGTLDRRRKQQTISLAIPAGGATLDLLVENEGRINYGGQIRENHKGITGAVTLGGDELSGWRIYSLPMTETSDFKFDGKSADSPTFYKGTFHLDSVGDTFLDMRGWTKGVVWVNGHNLGRYWFIGPQQTLYVPGPWLKAGDNQIVVFEEVSTKSASVEGLTEPVLEQLVPEPPIVAEAVAPVAPRPKFATPPHPTAADQIVAGNFSDGTSTQTIPIPVTKARYVCFESTSAFDGSEFASCAEFDLLGADNKALPRRAWHILYTDSEEDLADDNKAENMIDGDDSTFWHSLWGRPYTKHPHFVVIDLGSAQEFTAFRYEPRQSGDPGRIKGYAFFASDSPFGARM